MVNTASVVSGPLSVAKKHKARGVEHGAEGIGQRVKRQRPEVRSQRPQDRRQSISKFEIRNFMALYLLQQVTA